MPSISSRTQTIPAGTYKWIKPYTGVDNTIGYIKLDSTFICDGTSYGYASVNGTYLQYYDASLIPYRNGVWVDTKYQIITLLTDGEWIVQGVNSTWVNSSDQDYTNYLELTGGVGTPMKIYMKDGKALKANGKFIAPVGGN